jgi:hypothetical protein
MDSSFLVACGGSGDGLSDSSNPPDNGDTPDTESPTTPEIASTVSSGLDQMQVVWIPASDNRTSGDNIFNRLTCSAGNVIWIDSLIIVSPGFNAERIVSCRV